MTLLPIELQKKYGRFVTVRDKQVLDHIKANCPMVIIVQNDRMTLSVEQLRNGIRRFSDKSIASKFKNEKSFKLYSYLWVPDRLPKVKVDKHQMVLC